MRTSSSSMYHRVALERQCFSTFAHNYSHASVLNTMQCMQHLQQHGDSHELNPPLSGCSERTFTDLLQQNTFSKGYLKEGCPLIEKQLQCPVSGARLV